MLRRLGTTLCALVLTCLSACGFAADYDAQRERMIAEEIAPYGISNPRVLKAMRSTPRHKFVPAGFRQFAYDDAALPIGDRQTISPPFVVAYMTQELDPQPTDRVLELGTGSGYQAAVLSPLVREVYTIEIVERLAQQAERTLQQLQYENIHVRAGDGYFGWPEAAPFDKIIVTCSPEKIPPPLVEQLREGGRMIIPVGERYQQNLFRITKRDGQLQRQPLQATLFVPMTGAAEDARQVLPDPSQPRIVNGSFEDAIPREGTEELWPAGWHYLRQATLVSDERSAPAGKHYLSLTNDERGRVSQALQGLALDERRVRFVRLSAQVRGDDLERGATDQQQPTVLITFYDRRRAAIDTQRLGPWKGSFDWQPVSAVLRVPPGTREAIVRLSLSGGSGRLALDDLKLQPADPK
jgi:protein-L-isoaspartate(D-aspartate) O-methyltransferase